MLLNACFDDQCHAKRLVQIEKSLDHTISDEEAAARALDKLLSEVRSKRNNEIEDQQNNNNRFSY
jgi:hypothetical protein